MHINGIVPPMVTPLLDSNKLDHRGVENLIEHFISAEVHGVFILGTSGEAPNLSYDLRYKLVELVCSQVSGRIPVLVGITDTSQIESLRLAEKAAHCGANAVVAAPPYYFTPTQVDIKNHFTSLAEHSPLPLILYNMPSHTKVRFEPDTVNFLAANENIVGLKDSSGDLVYFQKIVRLMKERPEFSILMGPEELLMHSILAGGHGGVCGGANMFPKLYVDMYEAAENKDFNKMESLQEAILEVSSAVYSIETYGNGFLHGLKCALSILGICENVLAEPLSPFGEEERKRIQGLLENLDIIKREVN